MRQYPGSMARVVRGDTVTTPRRVLMWLASGGFLVSMTRCLWLQWRDRHRGGYVYKDKRPH